MLYLSLGRTTAPGRLGSNHQAPKCMAPLWYPREQLRSGAGASRSEVAVLGFWVRALCLSHTQARVCYFLWREKTATDRFSKNVRSMRLQPSIYNSSWTSFPDLMGLSLQTQLLVLLQALAQITR